MNPSTAAAVAIVDALVEAGVREVVLCPGSRSAPVAYAVRSAERAGRLRLHVRVDERSAGFLALGLGKLTGVPAVVVTTSGTAVANLHPAVLEAHHAHVPLIVLSADRPAELRGTGANQTTTQPGIFAGALRAEADLEPLPWPDQPTTDPTGVDTSRQMGTHDQAASVRVSVVRLVDAAAGMTLSGFPGSDAGPVHLNVQLREPLVPDLTQPVAPTHVSSAKARVGMTSVSRDRAYSETAGADQVTPLPTRTLVIIGDLPRVGQAEVALDWAARHRLPVVAEPFGPHPREGVVQHGVLALGDRDFIGAQAPECVIVVGRPTLSRPVSALVRRPDVRLVIIESGPQWSVPGRDSERVPWSVLDSPPAGVRVSGADAGWAAAWLEQGSRVEASFVADPPAWPSGAAIARTLGSALPPDAILFVGSSNAPRDLDTALGQRSEQLDIVASRGLAGIDGCVSTAVGVALAEPGRPAYALLGDLTFLHDANGLLIGPAEPRPHLTIVVLNDDGGGIFHVLEPGEPERAEGFERLFGTPTGTDLGALCRGHGIRHTRVETAADLAKAVAAQPDGISVVEIPADRASRRADAAELRSR